MVNIRKLESDLWESADLLRSGSKLTSNQYCMPVLGLIFLRYAYSRFKLVEEEILKNRPSRGGRVMPVGGVREKILAAKRAGITELILSEENRKDIAEIKPEYVEGLTFHYVKTNDEVLKLALV